MVQRIPTAETPELVWRDAIDLNLSSAFFCCQQAIGPMTREGWGRIINISSVGARTGGGAGSIPYHVAKAGIRGIPGRTASVPIIAVTALSGGLLQKRCADARFTAVFQKPFDCEKLAHDLRERIATSARSVFIESDGGSRSEIGGRALEQAGLADMVESAYLEAMADETGFERAKACVAEFVREATERSRCISEYLPEWQSEAIVRQCRELEVQAEAFGAVSVEAVVGALLDAVAQNEPQQAAAAQQELHNMLPTLWLSFQAHLRMLEARRGGQARRAA